MHMADVFYTDSTAILSPIKDIVKGRTHQRI